MILAQSAATAAVISLEDNLSVQDISYEAQFSTSERWSGIGTY